MSFFMFKIYINKEVHNQARVITPMMVHRKITPATVMTAIYTKLSGAQGVLKKNKKK